MSDASWCEELGAAKPLERQLWCLAQLVAREAQIGTDAACSWV
jgi:hypothetical protein